jgi:cell division protein FtsB
VSRDSTGSRVSRGSNASRASTASGASTSPRPAPAAGPKLTSRAAVLAVVLCAIALTLAYPVREYIAERRQIDQLATANAHLAAVVKHMRSEARSLNSPAVIAQEARDDLHMCFPSQTCYEVILPAKRHDKSAATPAGSPWYGRLWESVKKADGQSTR